VEFLPKLYFLKENDFRGIGRVEKVNNFVYFFVGGVGRRRNGFEGRKRGDLRVMFFEGSFPLLLNRVIDLGKGKKGNYPRFRKKTAHYEFGFRKKTAQNDFVTNLDNFCDRIFNGVGW
jgi:hypothetical protein